MLTRERLIKSKADKEKSKVDSSKDSNQDESADDKADQKEILVELNGIEDRIVRLTPNSSDLGSAILSKDGEDLYYFSAFEGGYDLWKMNLREKRYEASAQTQYRLGIVDVGQKRRYLFCWEAGLCKRWMPSRMR